MKNDPAAKTATEKTATVYRHIFAIAFEIESLSREASDLDPMQIREAMQKRLAEMQPWEFLENWEGIH
ncbi:MAG: hypothetical protein CL386_04515 [Acidiferrobacter sp.]|mgnify:CR=1 FL=1|nr:hypothetical protein [Acidiferrobacter sp.]